MTREILKWRVTLYWDDPILLGKQTTVRIAVARTPARALTGVLMSEPIGKPRTEQEMYERLYRVEVERQYDPPPDGDW